MTSRQLQGLREAISKAYLDQGYINSGVVIPDQSVADGIVILDAIEGRLVNISVTENYRLSREYVADRISLHVPSPLNIVALQEAIQLVQRNDRIMSLAAELVLGENLGEANLMVSIKEDKAWRFGLNVNNHRSESVGAEQANFFISHNNVSGNGDVFTFNAGISKGNESYSFDYVMPLTRRDSGLSMYHSFSDAVVLEEPFASLDVESETTILGIAITWPIFNNLAEELNIRGGIETKESETKLLGRYFSLSPGAIDGQSKASVVNLSIDWVKRSESRVIALKSTLRGGIDALDATLFKDNPGGTVEADGEFVTWMSQFQLVFRLNERARLTTRILFQKAFNPLLSLEKISIGGINTVRGYRENFLVRDNGLSVNVELPVEFQLERHGRIQLCSSVLILMKYSG